MSDVTAHSEPVSAAYNLICMSGVWRWFGNLDFGFRDRGQKSWENCPRSDTSLTAETISVHLTLRYSRVIKLASRTGWNGEYVWLGWEDSNLRVAESKSAALPLGYTPIGQLSR